LGGTPKPARETRALPGTILPPDATAGTNALNIATSDGILSIHRLQRPGGKMLPAQDLLRGFRILPGTRLPSRPMSALLAAKH